MAPSTEQGGEFVSVVHARITLMRRESLGESFDVPTDRPVRDALFGALCPAIGMMRAKAMAR
jgi:hypothetical protein